MRSRLARRGFTLLEMMVAMTLTMLVFAITIPFFRAQTQALGIGAGRLDALQNARYAESAIERELRRAGGVYGQPVIVQAAPYAVTFNVDFYARTTADPNAAYYKGSLDTLATESFQLSLAKTLPVSSKTYPTATYTDSNGARSHAETVSFFLLPDSSAGRNDTYTLYRRVNGLDSTLVASNLWIPPDTGYFFRYYRMADSGKVALIPQASLPLYWDDATRTIDSIGVVEMRIGGWYHNARTNTDTYRTLVQRTRLANATTLAPRSCGAAPAAPTSISATRVNNANGDAISVTVAWTASADDVGGALDVTGYAIMRRPSSGSTWTSVGNMPAGGGGTYNYSDYALGGGTWVYAVAAVDCGPRWSSTAEQSGTLVIP